MNKGGRVFDLEFRTQNFAQRVIVFCNSITKISKQDHMARQLLRSGTSVAANYFEATEAESRADFSHKLAIANKEVKESKLWLKLLSTAYPICEAEAFALWQEAHELNLILSKSIRTTKSITSK